LAVALVPTATAQTPVCSYRILNTFPHDPSAFTQGLLYAGGELYESTGLYGESSLRRVGLADGEVRQIRWLPETFFAEGLTMWQGRVMQLTWRENTCLIWDAVTFEPRGSFTYDGEGWGLTHDGRRLIMSDGTSTLVFRDSHNFESIGSIGVSDGGVPVARLNELEWIRGEIFANVFTTDHIARIDPDTGEVIAWIDLAGLLDPVPPDAGVLNGIAWDDDAERLFVTGKWWPYLFEIQLTGCPEIRLFFDGFESGGTAGWSVTRP
jgi:glutamine cyclotransferase